VAKNIGNNQINVDGDHPSILEIKNNHPELLENSFSFSGEMPSIPVAFFTFILLISFSTKSGFTEEKEKLF
jgi:hypothetical protein